MRKSAQTQKRCPTLRMKKITSCGPSDTPVKGKYSTSAAVPVHCRHQHANMNTVTLLLWKAGVMFTTYTDKQQDTKT